jgi:hypothetical protein
MVMTNRMALAALLLVGFVHAFDPGYRDFEDTLSDSGATGKRVSSLVGGAGFTGAGLGLLKYYNYLNRSQDLPHWIKQARYEHRSTTGRPFATPIRNTGAFLTAVGLQALYRWYPSNIQPYYPARKK